jgi:hypothetical protein
LLSWSLIELSSCDNVVGVTDLYRDKWIACTDTDIVIRWYYLWGAKRVPYPAIRGATIVKLGILAGKGRIWGTSNPRYWASLDPGRGRKDKGLILDLGTAVRPFITPDDVPAVAEILTTYTSLGPIREGDPARFV